MISTSPISEQGAIKREFASMGLGITVKRHPKAFEKSLLELDTNYSAYSKAVESFKNKLKWDYVA